MCGITGSISKKKLDSDIIMHMTNALIHRGPDAQNIFINNSATVALGHTRLSIIDLSAGANQPFKSGDGRYVIVFNGEIYNYKSVKAELIRDNGSLNFKTESDTEVILYAYARWGSKMCSKLEGMFSIVIYDNFEEQLFICRDRLGKKPLYYYHDSSCFVFSSEIKSLLKHPVVRKNICIDKETIGTFLHLGYIPEPYTIYTTIKKFPSGHFSILSSSELSLKTEMFWEVESDVVIKPNEWSEQAAKKALLNSLEEAVEKRMISDVPLGAFLSGGTDSSLIVAIASKLCKDKLKTFSIGFKDPKFNEQEYATRVAKKLNTEHYAYELDEHEAVNLLEDYLVHFDEPFADTSAVPTMLVSKHARKEVKVALTGDGGDELFSGYGSYDWAMRLANPLVHLVQSPLGTLFNAIGSDRLKRVSRMLENVKDQQRQSHIFSQEQYFFSEKELVSELLQESTKRFYRINYHSNFKSLNAAEEQALFDIKYYLKDDLLVKVDRASMYYALECRSPFLDQKVVALALGLPYGFKRKNGERKWILKELLKDFLPEELVYRPKWGFSIPLAKWMKGELSYLLEKYLTKEVIETCNVVRYEYVEQIKKDFKGGHNYLYNRLWVLIVMHKWLIENGV
ncbi:asparagine synthase (glutamine-hydrolyzing) [Chryseosolibacter indicus]|uniref:asparagine synthase (glutamine-hydrolyzing) n=1 Tax=Chryseosolibacter indicus TaxID=2782351 RepID=A0ABS5VKR4_9BACT|nr:asparagine synthase (glutamine-hydrolyzing) [Chryseosolibacter indicus]MBT1702040.1 asparagine synthase (glutamine-hydrolyzing) [Chryseosolibacter indicus]